MNVADAIASCRKIAIDTSPIIDFITYAPARGPVVEAIFVAIDDGRLTGHTLVLTLTETLVRPKLAGNQVLEQQYRLLLENSRNFHLHDIDRQIADRAAQLRASFQLKTPDAIQVAVALANGCDAFLTNDYKLRRIGLLSVLIVDELEL